MTRTPQKPESEEPIFGDLSQLTWDRNRIRCPRCQKLRASLLLVQARGRTEPICSTCERRRARPGFAHSAENKPNPESTPQRPI